MCKKCCQKGLSHRVKSLLEKPTYSSNINVSPRLQENKWQQPAEVSVRRPDERRGQIRCQHPDPSGCLSPSRAAGAFQRHPSELPRVSGRCQHGALSCRLGSHRFLNLQFSKYHLLTFPTQAGRARMPAVNLSN